MRSKRLALLLLSAGLAAALLAVLGTRWTGLPPLGVLLDPLDGLYRNARRSGAPAEATLRLHGLEGPVTVLRDDRGVPHIFAATDRDAVAALGYVVAQDRLFQLDFLPRVASGRLAEALGPSALRADRFLRSTGMEWGARRNLARIRADAGLEWELLQAFSDGVNAYLDGLDASDLPLEFRLIGYRPDRYHPLQTLRVLQYMTYDLTYRSDEATYAVLRERLSADDYRRLYPRHASLFVPIVPTPGGVDGRAEAAAPQAAGGGGRAARDVLLAHDAEAAALRATLAEGFLDGKGSNNWAVAGERSATGAPILAGDMHLSLTLPSIWYEVHLVTPTMNSYGVVVPGAPLPVEAFNDRVAWAFTNTGADQIDHYALTLDPGGRRYRHEGAWRDLEAVPDTIRVAGEGDVVDTLWYAHWGPVLKEAAGAVALRWVAHEPGRTLSALWAMNHATDYASFASAIRLWDAPMQNILYAGTDGVIAIRSTGYLPMRRGGTGAGLLDGSTDAQAWTGRVPFDELPHAVRPAQGSLSSTNQEPADSTYRHYLGHDWPEGYRSLRIDALLRAKARHTVDDLKRYQSDVHVVQADLFRPLLDTLGGLSPRADTLRRLLTAWDGEAAVDRAEPLVLDVLLRVLRGLGWDEPAFAPVQQGSRSVPVPLPSEAQLYRLLTTDPASAWLDVVATPRRETAPDLLRLALDAAADTLAAQFGPGPADWRWGAHHEVVFRHLTQNEALRALWRGPFEYPGFRATLSPAGGRPTTHSASWRVVVDLSQRPARGFGIYPGGQSGNPFSPHYDLHLPDYLAFRHYELLKPARPGDLDPARVSARLTLHP